MSRSRVIASATMALVAFLAISLSLNVVHASQGALEPMLNPAAAAPHQAAEVEMSWASLIDTDASTVDFSDYNDRVFVEAQVTPKKAVAPKQPAGRVANGSAASKSVSDRLSPAEQQARWAEFKKANNKTYKTPAEEQAAFEQFKKNRATIVAHNDSNQFGKINPKPFKSSGPLADLSPEQFKARFNKLRKPGLDKIKAKNQPAKVHNQQQQEAQKRNAKQKNSVKGVASLLSKVKGLGSKVKGAVAPKGKAAAPAKKVAAHRFAELSAELEAGADMDLESLAEAATETEAEAESVLEAESGLDLSTEHEVEMEHWLDAEAEAEAESEVSQQWPNLFGSKAVPSSNRAGSAGGSASSAGGSASSAGGSASSAGGSASSAGGSASSAGGSASSAGGSASSAGGSASSAGGSASSLMSKPVCVDRPTSATKSLLELDADEAAFIEAEWDLFGKKPAVPSSNRAGSAGGSASSAGGSASSAGGSASSAGGSASSAGGSASSAGGSASSAGGSASSAGGSASSAGGSASSAGGSASLPFCDQLIVQPTDESMMVKFEPFTGSVLNNPADKTPNQRLCRVVAHTWMELHAKTAAARLIQFGLSFVRGGGVERVLANPMLLCETDWNSFFKAMHPLQGHLRLAYDELKNHPSSHAVKGNALISKFVAAEPARSQLTCGSCWAQAAIGSFEVALQKAGKFTGPLSVQQILDCVRTSNSNGCSGGVPQDAMEWLQTHPAALEKDYPYTGVQGNCRAVSTGPKTAGWSFAQCRQETIFTKLTGGLIGANSYYVACEDPTNCPDQFKYESPLLIAVKNDGPFIAYVDASQWQHYAGGIYPPDKCSSTMVAGNHVVQLVGYGNDNGTPFWVIKNSWGENWGEGGFIRLPMGVNACGIANFCGQATTA